MEPSGNSRDLKLYECFSVDLVGRTKIVGVSILCCLGMKLK